ILIEHLCSHCTLFFECLQYLLYSSRLFVLFPLYVFLATPATSISALSLHDALPIYEAHGSCVRCVAHPGIAAHGHGHEQQSRDRSEEHTSELQSRENIVCRLLLEKKKYILYYVMFGQLYWVCTLKTE